MDRHALTGWLQALFAVLVLWSVSNVFLGYSIRALGVHPIVYSCVVFCSASLVLMTYSGYGKLAKETMRSLDTWGYGLSLMLNYIALLALLALVTATEATLLQPISVIISLFFGSFFMGRSIKGGQYLGALLIGGGIYLVLHGLKESDNLGMILLLIMAMGLIQTIRTYIAEFHRPHQYAATHLTTIKDRARIVALVMFVVSTLFFFTFLGLAVLIELVPSMAIPTVPHLKDFMNIYTVSSGMIAGVVLIAPLRFFEFSATHKIKTENYLAISSFAAAATWGWEWLTSSLTGVNIRDLTIMDGIACLLITLGGISMAMSHIRKPKTSEKLEEYLSIETQNIQRVEDTRELIANTLETFDSSLKKAAKALEIPVSIIEAVLMDKDKILAFREDTETCIFRNYRKNVALSDALTSLVGRTGFKLSLKEAIQQDKPFSLLYIDLDKFKPINDTYGHEAGDQVLRTVSDRLMEACQGSTVARLGGDEFCIILTNVNKNKAEKQIEDLIQIIEEPIKYEKEIFKVSASIGRASYPEDSTDMDELIELSDKNMYKVKRS